MNGFLRQLTGETSFLLIFVRLLKLCCDQRKRVSEFSEFFGHLFNNDATRLVAAFYVALLERKKHHAKKRFYALLPKQ